MGAALLAVRDRLKTAELLGISERTLRWATGDKRLTEHLNRALQHYDDKHEDKHDHEAELPGSGKLPLETALF